MKKHSLTTYNEIAYDLDISTRNTRYDIDKMNKYFHIEGIRTIEKKSKDVIIYSEHEETVNSLQSNKYIFSSQDCVELMKLIVSFIYRKLILNQLSQKLRASQSTI